MARKSSSIAIARFVAALLMALAVASPARAAAPADDLCREIRADIAAYLATGHPCACPYSLMRNGQACGERSAWAKPGGRAPRCYFGDVTGLVPPNLHPNPVRSAWPPPPNCALTV